MDLRVETYDGGPGRALLLHGVSSNAGGWWRVGPAVAELGYHVTAPDLRGHGGSPAATSHRFADYVADVAGLGLGWDLVLGHSFGGALALHLATPEFARRLILADPALVVPDTPFVRSWMLDPYQPPISAERIAADQPRWHPEDARMKAEALAQSSAEMVEQLLNDNPDWNVMRQMLAVTTDTLLLGGDRASGAFVSAELGESIAAQNPKVTFQLLPGAGHSMHRDSFDEFMGAIEAWVVAS